MGRRSVHIGIAALAASTSAAGTAFAAPPPQPQPRASGIQQYVEMLPTSTGDHAPGVGESTVTPLPPAKETRLHRLAGPSAATLEAVATSSQLGAPQKKLRVTKAATTKPEIKRLVKPPAAIPKQRIVSSSVGAVARGDGGLRGKVLLALAVLTTIAMAVAATRRHG